MREDLSFLHDMSLALKDSSPRSDWEVRQILHCVTGHTFTEVLASDRRLSEHDCADIERKVQARLSGQPLEYLVGEAMFKEHMFHLNNETFIPRVETELLVEAASAWIQSKAPREVHAVDLGTGSGCIPIAICAEVPNVRFDALECEAGALRSARVNIDRHGFKNRIQLLHSDYLKSLGVLEGADLIVANPPYICQKDYAGLAPEVRNEPYQALVAEDRGLAVIKRLCTQLPDKINAGAAFMCEIGYNQSREIQEFVKRIDSWKIERVIADHQGIERVLILNRSLDG